ncbi:MAG TPA: hypothetical protein VHQ23_05840 [Ilumatobacteraceae bacterium]|jgi:hypothetical protein|nr:hypothetical protein [Ilumatobacteraceae bacterium]
MTRSETWTGLYQRRADALPEGHEATCKTCGETRVFFTAIAPDPQGRATTTNLRMAEAWKRFHPCHGEYSRLKKLKEAA